MNKICLLLCCLLPGLFRAGAQELKMTECAPLTQIYGEVCESDELLPMGDVGVEFGYVLYRPQSPFPQGRPRSNWRTCGTMPRFTSTACFREP